MRKSAVFFILIALLASLVSAQVATNERKIISKVTPSCPELARRMHLQGVVKLEAVVRPNGTVKSTKVMGGNPVLVEAAADAVSKWKFEPTPNETTELVQVSFVSQ
jgi:TonB family protein